MFQPFLSRVKRKEIRHKNIKNSVSSPTLCVCVCHIHILSVVFVGGTCMCMHACIRRGPKSTLGFFLLLLNAFAFQVSLSLMLKPINSTRLPDE